ncbi:metal ABC transporter permease [Leptolyngbya sp. PCC 6406]|uniref:metal ABC transporter permease n=1 Tax=Leptolyngbya sp. PCC 6406 TaxID=1173264 RepID=UPI0002AD0B0C|nr:metal ABC transporter permease [Leptolyngbya sp. PCC 6406]
MDWLTVPLGYDFMRLALLAGMLVGVLCPVMGAFLVVQRMSLMGNVVAHSVLPGLVLAHALRWPLIIGAFSFGLLSTTVIAWVRSHSRIKADAIMALILASFFALGVVFITLFQSQLNLEALLFGDILSVTRSDIAQVGAIAIVTVVLIRLFYKELLFFTFDRAGAQAMGLPVQIIDGGLTVATTLAIVASLKTVGVILVVAMMVGPAIAAYLWVKELHSLLGLSALFGILTSVVGIYLSYYLDLPSGAAIALTIFGVFWFSLLASPSQGLLGRWWRQLG